MGFHFMEFLNKCLYSSVGIIAILHEDLDLSQSTVICRQHSLE